VLPSLHCAIKADKPTLFILHQLNGHAIRRSRQGIELKCGIGKAQVQIAIVCYRIHPDINQPINSQGHGSYIHSIRLQFKVIPPP
tara:strand:+ start:3064 stop:3318 length:255 start_codon:yes stop_codon:yes gene_type:complete